MHHDGVGCPDGQIARFTHLQTEINIVVGDAELILVQSTDLLVNRFSHQKAGGCDHVVVLIAVQTVHITGFFAAAVNKRMVRRAAQPHYHARMLNIPGWI
ncbi:hypothetical protein D3C71_1672550 [compost metagenome]